MSTDFGQGSRAHSSVRDEAERPKFEWMGVFVLALVVFTATRMHAARLHGHQAGVVAGLLLGFGVMAVVGIIQSIFEVRRGRRGSA